MSTEKDHRCEPCKTLKYCQLVSAVIEAIRIYLFDPSALGAAQESDNFDECHMREFILERIPQLMEQFNKTGELDELAFEALVNSLMDKIARPKKSEDSIMVEKPSSDTHTNDKTSLPNPHSGTNLPTGIAFPKKPAPLPKSDIEDPEIGKKGTFDVSYQETRRKW